MSVTVRPSLGLFAHLMTHEPNDGGGAVADVLFDRAGRLNYPGRQDLEQVMGYPEPYTLEHEARTIQGLTKQVHAAVRLLSREATRQFRGVDQTLDILWETHDVYEAHPKEGPSIDRLVAALVMVEYALENEVDEDVVAAAQILVNGMHVLGLPPTHEGLEELWNGAEPACCALGMVEV